MNITNTSRLPDYEVQILLDFVKRYVDGVIGKAELRVRSVKVTNCRASYSGCAGYGNDITLRIGPAENFPCRAKYGRYGDFFDYEVNDYREGLVMLAAHEFWHLARWQFPERRTNLYPGQPEKSMEHDCECVASDAIVAFRKRRAELDARIDRHSQRIAAKHTRRAEQESSRRALKSSPEYRLAQAMKKLERWERRKRLAETKLKKLHRSISALQRSIKAKLSNETESQSDHPTQ